MKSLIPIVAAALVLSLSQNAPAEQAVDPKAEVAQRVVSYVDAFNRRNVTAAAEHWSKKGEYLVAGGHPIVGREAIAAALKKLLATDEQFQLSVGSQRFRAVSDDVVLEEGVGTLVSEKYGAEHARYLAVHVKQNGVWYRDTVRETAMEAGPTTIPDRQSLTSLLGNWKHESDSTTLTVKSEWKHDQRFISRSFQLQGSDGQLVTATEIIGWDPAARTLRSWGFDSQGGFEQAVWHRDGERWLIKADAALPNGSTATEQRSVSIDSDGNLRTQVLEQQFGGRLMPGSDPITLVRQAAQQITSN